MIVRELQLPGHPVFAAIVDRWGAAVVAPDGTLDRAALAARVFDDAAELAALNAIVHPVVASEMTLRRADTAQRHPDAVVVLDVPLLVRPEGEPVAPHYRDVAGIAVVDVDPQTAVGRLVSWRGLSEDDARARIASQVDPERRLSVADFVIDNNGTLEELDPQVEACYRWARSLS